MRERLDGRKRLGGWRGGGGAGEAMGAVDRKIKIIETSEPDAFSEMKF